MIEPRCWRLAIFLGNAVAQVLKYGTEADASANCCVKHRVRHVSWPLRWAVPLMQEDSRQPSPIGAEKARTEALKLLKEIETAGDPAVRRQLARRAFHLTQIASMEESPRQPTARLEVDADARESRTSAAH